MARGRLNFESSSDIANAIEKIGRTEDIRLSPRGDKLAVVGFLDQKIYLFAVRIDNSAGTPRVEIFDYLVISSPKLRYPHGVAFLDNEHIVVCSRSGGVDIFKLPHFDGCSHNYELVPIGSINGSGYLLAKVKTPGSVDSYKLQDNRYRILVCNNHWHFISSHVVELSEPIRIHNDPILIQSLIKIPDGISINPGATQVAVSNHVSGESFVYGLSEKLSKISEPEAILGGAVCPHGIRFAPDGRRVYVADAASQFLHVYESEDAQWQGHHSPLLSARVMDDDSFFAGRYAAREGGLKGVDVDATGSILLTTHMHDVIAFYHLDELLSAPSRVDRVQMNRFARERDEGLQRSQKVVLGRQWDFKNRLLSEFAGAQRLVSRAWKRCRAMVKVSLCYQRNLMATEAVTDSRGPVLSMTTFGERLNLVYIAIESIAAGSRKPSRFILWLDNTEAFRKLPISLRRLQSRGLEIRLSGEYGPHTKYYPYVASETEYFKPLVTADDDVIYPRGWLDKLILAHEADPQNIHCHRAHRMLLRGNRLAPYNEWPLCVGRQPSQLNFLTGVGGVIYPLRFLNFLKIQKTDFQDCCPNADDIWLTINAIRSGIKVAQVEEQFSSNSFLSIPGSQKRALSHMNVAAGGNQTQLIRTMSEADFAALRAAKS
jgi:hypothetical protein